MEVEEQERLKEIAKSNYNLCAKYMLKNRNESFISKISEFAKIFETLSHYTEEVQFRVDYITKFFAIGKIIKEGHELSGQIHISQISQKYVRNIKDYLTVGEIISAKVVNYNAEHNTWNLTCLE